MIQEYFKLKYTVFLCLIFYCTNPTTAQTDTIYIGGGGFNHLNVTVSTSHSEGVKIGENTLGETGLLPNLNAASRFLAQSTLGADYELIEEVSQKGISTWIEEQLNLPPTFSHKDFVLNYTQEAYDSIYARAAAINPDTNIVNQYPKIWYWHTAWLHNVMDSPDVLRTRLAFAWSELFVISQQNDLLLANPLSLADYYDVLFNHSFGNFRDLLEAITLHPSMGNYLYHINNAKTDLSTNTFPDENFAREIMQLFTIGLVKLNMDGTPQLDNEGNEIQTYNNSDISQLAKIFTGLSYGDNPTFGELSSDQNSFTFPMLMHNDWHEPGEKQLINGHIVPDRNPVDGMADVSDALDLLFNHPNVGPFIGHFLIQRLVKNNPSPAYIERVAMAFNDNGQGIRGDMKAVIRAILLDPEARDCNWIYGDDMGKLREPLIRYTHLMRAFNLATLSGEYRIILTFENCTFCIDNYLHQIPLGAPSVFNFFRPNYRPNGLIEDADKFAPEFQILDDRTVISYPNGLNHWLFSIDSTPNHLGHSFLVSFDLFPNERLDHYTKFKDDLDLSDEELLAGDEQLEELVERLNLILVHGLLTETSKNYIIETLQQMSPTALTTRVKMALNLIMLSPDYLIFR